MTRTIWPNMLTPLIVCEWHDDGNVAIRKSKKLEGSALLLVSVALVAQFQAVFFSPHELDDDQ